MASLTLSLLNAWITSHYPGGNKSLTMESCLSGSAKKE